jgi:thioredoxin-like negative regulator of GroEL
MLAVSEVTPRAKAMRLRIGNSPKMTTAAPKIEHITANNYEAFIRSSPFALMHFWARWDGRFLLQRRAIEDAAILVNWPGKLAMFDTDDQPSFELLRSLGICTVPTLFYYRDGIHVDRQNGSRSSIQIADIMRSLIDSHKIERNP